MGKIGFSLVVVGIAVLLDCYLIMPSGMQVFANFYPIPFTLVIVGALAFTLSFFGRNKETWQFACASYASALGFLAWWLAIVIDHTCMSGWYGFLSLACLLSLRFPPTARHAWELSNWKWLDILQQLLLVAGIVLFVLFVISFIIYPFTPHG